MAQTDDAIETPALGRPFQLGMLYDCRKDALIPGVTLWDYSSLQKDLTIRPQPKTESEIIASDSIDDKASALDISASLKKSRVLCCAMGLETAGGIRGPERRIVLIGRPGNGKSATGNTILGIPVFDCSSDTQGCQKEETWQKGRKIVVVDTPDFADTVGIWNPLIYFYRILSSVTQSVQVCSPGSHVILWVIRPSLFSQGNQEVVELMKKAFNPTGKNYLIVLFTHPEDLKGKTLERYISEADPSLRDLVSQCGNRYLAFDNKAEGEEREAQVAQLMTMIDDLVKENRKAPCYTENLIQRK